MKADSTGLIFEGDAWRIDVTYSRKNRGSKIVKIYTEPKQRKPYITIKNVKGVFIYTKFEGIPVFVSAIAKGSFYTATPVKIEVFRTGERKDVRILTNF